MTQGHVDDQIMPGWFATSRSIHFFMDSLNLSGWDVLRLMEQWACMKSASMSFFSLATPHAYKKTSLSSVQNYAHYQGTNCERCSSWSQYTPCTACMMADTAFSMGCKQWVQEASQDELH
jgi:uncharacterized CHY-type Zn-finger protein